MTGEEKQEIVSDVIQALKTNSATIDQLTEVSRYEADDYLELNRGRKISVETLAKQTSQKVVDEVKAVIAEAENIVDEAQTSANEALQSAQEAKKHADIASQSGEIAQEAKEQGELAEQKALEGERKVNEAIVRLDEAVSKVDEAVDSITNDVLLSKRQDLTEEEQAQVWSNLGLDSVGVEFKTYNPNLLGLITSKFDTDVDSSVPFFFLTFQLFNNSESQKSNKYTVILIGDFVTDFQSNEATGKIQGEDYDGKLKISFNLNVTVGGYDCIIINEIVVPENYSNKYKGYFDTVPTVTGEVGSYAYVGNPRHLYLWEDGAWADKGEYISNVDMLLDENSEKAIANKAVYAALLLLENKIYSGPVAAMYKGLTVRFSQILEEVSIIDSAIQIEGDVVYVESRKCFCAMIPGTDGYEYYKDWPSANLYMNEDRTEPLKDKIYLCGNKAYTWDEEKSELAESLGGGSGSGFLDITKEFPLEEGFYTLETAVAALAEYGDVKDEDKPGKIITFEVSAGKWEDYRFEGTSISKWNVPTAWKRFGGADAIKRVVITQGGKSITLLADENGQISFEIPNNEVDQSVNEGSTNAVSGNAVAAEFKKAAQTYGVALQLNEIGEGDNKVFTISLLSSSGEVLSTTDQFSGGGGSTATTKIVLTRVTPNKTIKVGDEVKLTYNYDHIESSTGESTGNPGKVTVTIIQGANVNTLSSNISAGSSNSIDVTKYMGVGTNTVRVRVEVGEGDEMQVSQITWTINVVQLSLTSSFNIATLINKGDFITVPYALSGSGDKTLRCFVDGEDIDDRSITASSANGSFSINTSNMSHGTHSIQLVVERELSEDNIIRSNSIYFAIGVREEDNNEPLVSARFDYSGGDIITGSSMPFINAKQYDTYILRYAVYDPQETPTKVDIYVGNTLASSAMLPFEVQELQLRPSESGQQNCRIECAETSFSYKLVVEKSDLNISEPTDNLILKLSASGRSNNDINKEEWTYQGINTVFSGFKWGGDGWINNALRINDQAKAVIQFYPLRQPEQNVTNAMAFIIKFKVSEVIDENAEVIRCIDSDGTGFVITTQEARMTTKGKSTLSMKMASGETYEVAFVSFPKETTGSSEYEKLNTEMVYLYINGIMSGSVQRAASDSVYQSNPEYVSLGAEGATLDVYMVRSYSSYLSDSQVLDCYLLDQDSVDEMFDLYESNNVIDGNGNVTVDSVPNGMRYLIVTGRQDNGVPTVLQAAVNNDKDPKYDVDEMLCVVKGNQSLNFRCVGGCIRLQGTSSLAYPIKNYRIYFKNASKVAGDLYLGCDEQGVGGTLQETAKYSFRPAGSSNKAAAPVDCFCLKADFAESSSSHNTGMAKLVQNILTAAGELTPAQAHCSEDYGYDVRTTIDGEPCYLFYRGALDETPQFLGKFNFNNDKSTEAVFGFCDIPGYHDQAWVTEKFDGVNPTECWEFLNNDYPMGMFLDDDFDTKGEDGTPNWLKVFEARFPDDDDINAEYEAGTKKPKYLEPLVKWVKSTQNDGEKFKTELADWFDVDYLCDYYMFTEIFGCVDQRVKNMMMGFWYNTDKDKVLAYMIFYDCDTILGVRNDGRLKYGWDIDENTTDPELSTDDKTVYAYAGHDSILWKNLREQFPDELQAAYRRIRERMSNSTIFTMFDDEQSAKFCERIYNLDALNKYVEPKTIGVEVNKDGSVTNVKYSYLEAMQGSRQSHRHWWVTNRMGLFDARYSTGQYTSTDISFKGNSAAGAKVKAVPARDFYFEFRREGDTMVHQKVTKDIEWSYTYGQMANVGTIFHLYGGEWMKKLDLSAWGGFTDMSLPYLPVLEELILGTKAKTYALTELVIETKLPMMRKLSIVNYLNLPSIDLTGCTRLEEVDATGCTMLSSISFAEGSMLNKLHLPSNYQTLILRSMRYLTWDAITFDNKKNLTGIWIENCELIDGKSVLDELFALGGLKYARITGINLEGNGDYLVRLKDAGLGGIDSQGITTNSRCKLIGTYQLTKYIDDSLYKSLSEYFDELNIRQPEYTMIEFDDTVADDANISNLDNNTGYKFDSEYVPSAHINVILNKRHRVLGKQCVKGEMTIIQLHDENSNYYADAENVADASLATLDGTSGDVFVHEPHYWYKGINDYLNGKKYACFSSNEDMPKRPDCRIYKYDDIEVKTGYKILIGNDTYENALVSDASYHVCRVNVAGYKKVRFPTVLGTSMVGSCFTDYDDNVVKDILIDTLAHRFVEGMYLICDIPEGAVTLNFTIGKYAEFDMVVLSNSDRIEDMEPDWVEHVECLTGVFEACNKGTKLYSAALNIASVGSLTQPDFIRYAQQRNMQIVDWEMHKDVANLFFAKYGRRDSQDQCGYGQATDNRTIGRTSVIGMQDTVSYGADGVHKTTDAWYERNGQYTNIYNNNCLGYENWFGGKYEWMEKVSLPNKDSYESYKYFIEMPDGSVRKVKSGTVNGYCMAVYHQKYMDIIGVGSQVATATTYYCDYFEVSGSTDRVVRRSYYNAHASGGVSFSVANNDASNANANIGSRLAFRGKIVKAESVSEFKAKKAIY